jgi:hypothetical protein
MLSNLLVRYEVILHLEELLAPSSSGKSSLRGCDLLEGLLEPSLKLFGIII